MKRKCTICQSTIDCHTYKETYICEDCLDYIRGLKLSDVNRQNHLSNTPSRGDSCVNHDAPAHESDPLQNGSV